MVDHLLVFFGSTEPEERRVFHGGPRLWKRKPILLYAAICGWLARKMAGNPPHVCVGWQGTVYDVSAIGSRLWETRQYATRKPGLIECWEVPLISMPELPPLGQARLWRSLARAVLRGRFTAENCVTFTTSFIRSSGWKISDCLWSPSQVRQWLTEQGFVCVRFDTED